MADEDAADAELFKNFFAGHPVGGGEQKVRGRVKHGKPAAAQLVGGVGALGNDFCRYIGKIGLVGDGRHARRLGHGIDIVGAVTELDAVHIGNQLGPRDAEAQPRPRQIVGFGEGVGDDEVVVGFQQRQAA